MLLTFEMSAIILTPFCNVNKAGGCMDSQHSNLVQSTTGQIFPMPKSRFLLTEFND